MIFRVTVKAHEKRLTLINVSFIQGIMINDQQTNKKSKEITREDKYSRNMSVIES